MRALLLALTLVAGSLVVAVGTSAAEDPGATPGLWYYNSPCQQEGNLYDWLSDLPWAPYEYGVYDCSEMSAYIEWLAENCGYHAVIGCGDAHCWVLVEGMAFEPTGQYWVDHRADLDYYSPDVVYDSIPAGPEWDWWRVHPELRGGK